MFQKEIGLCAQNKLAVLSSIVNIFGGGDDVIIQEEIQATKIMAKTTTND